MNTRKPYRRRRAAAPLAVGSAAAILLCGCLLVWLASPGTDISRSAATIGGPFSLTDDRGNPVTERSFAGKYLLVYFGYTTCRDVCPATLNTLGAAMERLGRKADLIQPLFVTIDPAHDTPAVLHRYVKAFSSRIVGLSGTEAELGKIADEYKVVRMIHNDAAMHAPASLDHSSVLYVMAPDGTFIAPVAADASAETMAREIGGAIA